MRRALALVSIASMSLPACLSSAHRVPSSELTRLANTDPDQRGSRVRVVQTFTSSDQPPQAQPIGARATVVIVDDPQPRPYRHRRHRARGVAPRSKPARGKKDDARLWIVVAAVVAVGLAATEGARYDGWVQVHPMHPLHLKSRDGSYSWLPLAHLTPEIAASTEKAWLRETEGPWRHLGRAPLSRTGFTYSLLLGAAEIPSVDGGLDPGFLGHIQLGYFFEQSIGLLLDVGLGWRANRFGDAIFEQRYAGELQLLPISAGKLHAGIFGHGGRALRLEDSVKGGVHQGSIFGGGALVQLELTTRRAITARAGVARFDGQSTSDISVGVSIY